MLWICLELFTFLCELFLYGNHSLKEEPLLLTSSIPRRPLTLQPEDPVVQTEASWGGTMGATDPLMEPDSWSLVTCSKRPFIALVWACVLKEPSAHLVWIISCSLPCREIQWIFFPINHFTPSESSLTRSVYLTSPGNPGPVMSDDILYALKRITVGQMINNTLP